MGLWMIQSVRKEIAEEVSFGTICEMASKCRISSIVDANDDRFLAPEHMTAEVQKACEESGQQVPQGITEIAAVIYNSLAVCYAKTLKRTGRTNGLSVPEDSCCRWRRQRRLSEPADSRKDRKDRTGGTDRGNCHRQSGGADDHRKGMQQFERCEKLYFPFLRNQTI